MFRNNALLTIVLLLVTGLRSIAQAPSPAVALPFPNLPSANATALGTYGTYPISYTNGTPNISIPLYEIKTSKMSLPISLSYHANGIKVHEMATSVGLGWTLNAGGAITRQINDIPDFDYNGYKHKPVVKGVHASPAIGSSPAFSDPANDEQRYYYGRLSMAQNQSGLQKYDGQPDDFFFNFGGKSGKFILKNTLDSALASVFTTIPYSPLKIQYTETYGNYGNSFTIHDTDGTTYIFGRSIIDNSPATETSSTSTTTATSYFDKNSNNIPATGSSESGTNVTAWYLTEIISPDQSETMSFKYSSQYNATNLLTYQGKSTNMFYNQALVGVFKSPTSSTSLSQVTSNNINLSEIDFKNGKVVFEYDTREDRGTYKLSKIKIYQLIGAQYSELKQINMNQSYFTSNATASQVVVGSNDLSTTKRLRLDGLSEEGINSDGTHTLKPPYKFNYYSYGNTSQIAYLGEYGQDLWGYWNGKANTNLIIANPISTNTAANRVPDLDYAKAGTIQTIQYPTGGKTEFQYELNKSTRSYVTSDSTFQTYHLSSIGAYNTISTDQTFTATQNITATIQVTVNSWCTSNCLENQAQVYLADITGGGTGTVVKFLGFSGTPTLPANLVGDVILAAGHIYRFYLPNPGGNSTGTPRYRIEATLLHAGLTSVVETAHVDPVATGGLKVTKIINRDFDNAVLGTKRYNYLLPYYISDIFTGDFNSVGNGYNFLKYQLRIGNQQSGYTAGLNLLPYLQNYTENFTISMAGATDGSIAYQEVEEFQEDKDGNSIGKTVYGFNMAKDETTDNFSYIRINNSWRRNQLLKTSFYKGSGSNFVLVKDITNIYSDLFPALQDTTVALTVNRTYSAADFYPSTAGTIPNYSSVGYSGREFDGTLDGSEIWNTNAYHVSLINQINYRNALTSTITTDYDLNGANPVSVQTNNFYNNPDHLMVNRVETIKSNLDKAIRRTSYTSDFVVDNCNTNIYLSSLKLKLSALKSNFDSRSLPVYNQWIAFVFDRWFTLSACLSRASRNSPDFNNCITQANYNANDQAIINLYNQYGTLKATYRDSVRQAVNNFTQDLVSYTNCYNSQFTVSVDSVKALMQMQQNNQLVPVETSESWLDHISNNEYMQSINKIAFRTVGTTSEVGKTFLGTFPSDKITFDTYIQQPNNYLRNVMNYDAYSGGNLTVYHKADSYASTFIWGYDGQSLLADVRNASGSQVAYTGFEDGDTQSGNWTFTHTGVQSTISTPNLNVRSGNAIYNLTSGVVTTTVGRGIYVVSYWANGPLSVNGSAPSIIGNTDSRGWQYFEHQITLNDLAAVTVIASTGTLLDELRLYPVGAQMTSYTYSPMVGITSIEDVSGRNVFYEYDAFQRLVLIRNDKGEIIKTYKYNYAVH